MLSRHQSQTPDFVLECSEDLESFELSQISVQEKVDINYDNMEFVPDDSEMSSFTGNR